jgi:hypothetical protein
MAPPPIVVPMVPVVVIPVIVPMAVDVVAMVVTPVVPLVAIWNAIGPMVRPISRLPLLAAAALPWACRPRVVAWAKWTIVVTGSPRPIPRFPLFTAATLTRPRVVARPEWTVAATRSITAARSEFTASTLARARRSRQIAGPKLFATTTSAGAANVGHVAGTGSTLTIMEELSRRSASDGASDSGSARSHGRSRHSTPAATSKIKKII